MAQASRTKEEQRLSTRRALVAEARRLFAARGYSAVSLAEIVRGALVTKGALYHQFESKADLFRAVVERVQEEVGARVAASAEAVDHPLGRLVAGCEAFLLAGRDPEVQQIMLIDAPAVLGWNEWRAMDERHSARHLTEALTHLVEAGVIAEQPIEPLVRLLSGAMNEAALWLARSSDPGDLRATVSALTSMVESLRRS
ncbi:TetR/AcrR family transcriptional regulator [Sinosporangium siamense]|uniref:TetR family transcriptional regulator n=1 Tax=Sinosporangium siamense TaxID=1367973 RepID=A0A919RCG2_9ACTN|nr:TetR/AcrR family transcriptional regulator [Sinosporangium siamense]GII91348.1 TetR family transcriptional regulator [Sinosporangium siamense]